MSAPVILSVGEVLWDLLPTGAVLGGAPANFAAHAQALGGQAWLASRVGQDDRGHEILRRLQGRGLSIDLIGVDDSRPTGTVSVTLTTGGEPHYVIHEPVAWDALSVTTAGKRAAANAQAVCFGSLAQRAPTSRATIRTLVAATPSTALRVFDLNLRQSFYSREVIASSLALANVLKLNETELPVLAAMFSLTGEPKDQLRALARRFQLRAVAFTRGADGSCLLVDEAWSEHRGIATRVEDTVGAGDSFTAAFVLGLLAGWPLAKIHERASEVAAYVCSQVGPMPVLPERFSLRSTGR